MSIEKSPHIPVMLDEVLVVLAPSAGKVYVDATFGRGGYSRAILKTGAKVIGLDRDEEALKAGRALAAENNNFQILKTNFGALDEALIAADIHQVDGIVFDIGVSSPQLDEAERGFSFSKDGPLDMRMDQSQGQSAADLVNTLPEADLANIFWLYGEERHSRRIAAAIIAARRETPFSRTVELANVIRGAQKIQPKHIDGATRCFQALRIAVNDELGELERGLAAAERMLNHGGRLVVVSFHSLEDRIVKNFLKTAAGKLPNPSRYVPVVQAQSARFTLIGAQPVDPSEAECARNPRSRSARLRAAERLLSSPLSSSSRSGGSAS